MRCFSKAINPARPMMNPVPAARAAQCQINNLAAADGAGFVADQ